MGIAWVRGTVARPARVTPQGGPWCDEEADDLAGGLTAVLLAPGDLEHDRVRGRVRPRPALGDDVRPLEGRPPLLGGIGAPGGGQLGLERGPDMSGHAAAH